MFRPVNERRAIDLTSPFYFAQLFVLIFALSIIFFAHFQQKLLLIGYRCVLRDP